jgi:hypothetical protein
MMLIRFWQPPKLGKPGEWQPVMLGGAPLRCSTEQAAEAAVRQLAARGRVGVAIADDESVAMKATPRAFWKWRAM